MASNTSRATRAARLARGIGVLAAAAPVLAACDVVNPGRVLDEDLDNPEALRIVVNGLAGDMTLAHRNFGWDMNVLTGDMSGSSAYKSRVQHWQGRPDAEDAEDYNSLYAVVSVGDRAISRINEVLGDDASSSPLAAEAYVWAGYANRYAGDAFCQAVIDGGAPQPRSVYHERAVDMFTAAIEIASEVGPEEMLYAAYGGRAHSRMQLGEWEGAVEDARRVPDDFRFDVKMYGGDGREWNEIFYESARRTNLNVRWTWFDWYQQNYDDPRVTTYTLDDLTAADGSGLNLIQGKYLSTDADIAAIKGWEMRLIEAEYYITQTSDWPAGLDLVNYVRTSAGMAPWTATTQQQAFLALKYERAIVLWLESRRGGDLWRWGNTAAGDPILGKMYELTPPPAEYPGGAGGLTLPQDQRAICLPFSITLASTNPNIELP